MAVPLNSFSSVSELPLTAGQTAKYGGHTFELVDVTSFEDARSAGVRVRARVDGRDVYARRLTKYLNFGQIVPTPSVQSGPTREISHRRKLPGLAAGRRHHGDDQGGHQADGPVCRGSAAR